MLENRISMISKALRVEESFDLICRPLIIGERNACVFFIDGFVKDDIMQRILDFFDSVKKEDLQDEQQFLKAKLPYVEVIMTSDMQLFETNILSGVTGLIIDGFENLFLIDCRTYPARTVAEPDKDKVLRGSRDGFVETIVMNAALIRRRIRDVNLTISMTNAGTVSKTDIAICYMDNKVDKQLLEKVKNRIAEIDCEALTMNQESLAECLYKGNWFNPFPKFKYSERPDATASAIMEGHIVILVDNSPSAMILPTNFFDVIEEANDYYFPPITATYMRLSRLVISFFTIFLTPVFLLLVNHPQWVPEDFAFITIENEINISVFWQFIILEIAIDGLKLAAVNTPNMLNTPLSIIAGIILSDSAVKSGWFNDECLLYMAFAAFGTYTIQSFEFGFAMKFARILLLIFTELFALPGLLVGSAVLLACLFGNKTIARESYMYPLWPLSVNGLMRRFIRLKKKNNT